MMRHIVATSVLVAATFTPILTAFSAGDADTVFAPVAPAQPQPSQPSLPVVSPAVSTLSVFDAELLRQINVKRAAVGAAALEEAKGLTTQSKAWSGQLATGATGNVLAHNPQSFEQTLSNGASTRVDWGENVARWSDTGVTADAVLGGYWGSYLNQANLLDRQFRYVGVATVTGSNGSSWNTLTFTDKVDAGQTYDPAAKNVPLGQLNSASITGSTLRVEGWGYDPDTATSPVQVQIKDTAADGTIVTNTVMADTLRSDIATQYPGTGDKHGFDSVFNIKTRGDHQICATLINAGAGTSNPELGCLKVTVGAVVGSFDSIEKSGSAAIVTGWTVDPDVPTSPTTLIVTDQGPTGAVSYPVVTANVTNPNVDAAIPGVGAAHGFAASVPLSGVGTHSICIKGVGVRDSNVVVDLGCKTVTLAGPLGSLEAVTNTTTAVTLNGWAVDPEAPQTASSVKVTVNVPGGAPITPAPVVADKPSAAAAAAFPAGGNNHGYVVTVPLTGGGVFSACVVAVSVVDPASAIDLGCKDFVVSALQGDLGAPTAANGILTVKGWAADKTVPTQSAYVELTVTGPSGSAVYTVTANTLRADVNRVFPGLGEYHGYVSQIPAAGKGVNTVCGVMVSPSKATTKALWCKSVTVS